MTDTKQVYPAVTIERHWSDSLQMWRGDPLNSPREADVLIQVDIEYNHILKDLTEEERLDYKAGLRVTTYNIDPAYFGKHAGQSDWVKVQTDEHNTPTEEQASGTDVLPSDCSGCPLYEAKENKGDTVPVSRVDRLFLRYLLWKEVYHSGYTAQMGQILARLFPDEQVVPKD